MTELTKQEQAKLTQYKNCFYGRPDCQKIKKEVYDLIFRIFADNDNKDIIAQSDFEYEVGCKFRKYLKEQDPVLYLKCEKIREEFEDWYNNYGYVPEEDKHCGPDEAICVDK